MVPEKKAIVPGDLLESLNDQFNDIIKMTKHEHKSYKQTMKE